MNVHSLRLTPNFQFYSTSSSWDDIKIQLLNEQPSQCTFSSPLSGTFLSSSLISRHCFKCTIFSILSLSTLPSTQTHVHNFHARSLCPIPIAKKAKVNFSLCVKKIGPNTFPHFLSLPLSTFRFVFNTGIYLLTKGTSAADGAKTITNFLQSGFFISLGRNGQVLISKLSMLS